MSLAEASYGAGNRSGRVCSAKGCIQSVIGAVRVKGDGVPFTLDVCEAHRRVLRDAGEILDDVPVDRRVAPPSPTSPRRRATDLREPPCASVVPPAASPASSPSADAVAASGSAGDASASSTTAPASSPSARTPSTAPAATSSSSSTTP